MATNTEAKAARSGPQVPPLTLTRSFHARPETVFKAWTTAEHVKRWFCPIGSTIPEAEVDPRVGGVFAVMMRFEDGSEHRTRGTFVEFDPPRRLVLDLQAFGPDGKPMFWALTEVNFSDTVGETGVNIVQRFREVDPAIAEFITADGGEGWGSTLDKLEAEVARMVGRGEIVQRSAAHATFHLTRTYPAPVARVWKALTDPAAKAKWFGGPPEEMELLERHMDVRVGGTERAKGRWKSGVVSTFDATYFDVISNERLVYSYVMHLDDRKISVSLATMELRAEGARTTLAVTEQGVFLDGYDDAGSREHGTGFLLDALGASLVD